MLLIFLGNPQIVNNVNEYRKSNKKWTIQRNIEYTSRQDEEKQSKNTIQCAMDTTVRKQSQITYIRHDPYNKKLGVKTNRTSVNYWKISDYDL